MADDGWQGMSHQEIVSKLSGLGVESARAEADRWSSVYGAVSESVDTAMKVRSKLLDSESWSGEAANAAYDAVDRTYKKIADPDTGLAAEAGKLSQAAEQDGETLIAAGRVPQNYPVPDKNASKDEKQQALNAIRAAAQSAYTNPMSTDRPKVTDPDVQQLGPTPNDPGGAGGNGGGGSGAGGSGSGTQTPAASMVWPVRTLSRSLPVVKGNRPARAKVKAPVAGKAVVRVLARVPVVVRELVLVGLVPGWVLALVVLVFLSVVLPRLVTRRRRPVQASAGRVQVWAVPVV
ncbi:Hypothetical protein ERS075643_02200 [Mycobacteroides abscessus]|nr:Hypothetical protein ERS075643_02200 [Mycobacteroides abscessus]